MSRIPRKLLGEVYIHNMVQGINKEYIFKNELQKKKYIELLAKYNKDYDILIVAYCIMDNHAHIIMYSKDIKYISLYMKKVNEKYARFYNRTENRVGYVFRNRFESKPIYTEKQLLTCIKYVHMNPVKAKIVQNENDYEFSSYKDYLNKNINSKVLNPVFLSRKNYPEKLKNIEYKELGIDKENVNIKKALESFVKENYLDKNEISKESIIIKRFILYLKHNEYKFTKKEIAEVLGMSRAKLYRILKYKEKT